MLSGGTFRALPALEADVARRARGAGRHGAAPRRGARRRRGRARARGASRRPRRDSASIVNADDYGRTAGISGGTLAAHRGGIVTSATAMVLEPAAARGNPEGARRGAGARPGAPRRPDRRRAGRPRRPRPSPPSRPAAASRETPKRCRRASIATRFAARSRRRSRSSSGWPGAAVAPRLAPSLRAPPGRRARLRRGRRGGAASPCARRAPRRASAFGARACGRPTRSWTASSAPARRSRTSCAILEALPEGTSELMCHPGFPDEALLRDSTYAADAGGRSRSCARRSCAGSSRGWASSSCPSRPSDVQRVAAARERPPQIAARRLQPAGRGERSLSGPSGDDRDLDVAAGAREERLAPHRGETPAAAATMRRARSRSFADPARRSTIHGPNTFPAEASADVVIWFNASFVAVPAFSRVEPATTSGPTSSTIARSARRESPGRRLAVRRTVRAPRRRARTSAPSTNGVTELAEMPSTRSPRPTPAAPRAPSPRRSSAPSRARKTAVRPPAIDGAHAPRARAEGRRQLGRLEHGEAARRAGAEEQAVAARDVRVAEPSRRRARSRAARGAAPRGRADPPIA